MAAPRVLTAVVRVALIAAFIAGTLVPLASGSGEFKAGSLDPAFGKRGAVVMKTTAYGRARYGRAIALQSDGKIVVAGWGGRGSLVARYKRSGSLDRAFGKDGAVTDDLVPYAVAVQPNGDIIVGGIAAVGRFGLVRYHKNGSLDQNFGNGGRVVTTVGVEGAFLYGLAIRPDGRIVAAGSASDGTRDEVALAQYNSDGSLDQSFGSGGIVMTDLCGDASARGIVLLPNGKIVAAGNVGFGPLPDPSNCYGTHGLGGWLALLRYKPDGSLDPSFGAHGEVLSHFGTSSAAYAVALAPHRKIVVGGVAHDFAVARYKANGSLDRDFGGDGVVITHFGRPSVSVATAVAASSDGKVVAAGLVNLIGDQAGAGVVARFNPNGRRDKSFGKRGIVTTRISGWPYAEANAMALQPNGKIDVAGNVFSVNPSKHAWLVARYLGEKPCIVPKVRGRTLRSARRKIRCANCSLGRVATSFSRSVAKGRVLAQRPGPGRRLRARSKVKLVISMGKRH